ncbi:MAG: hypothetical protein EP338_11505 [Bacteroidetes bacterium]|nr:MAG: hypothetical protein EP338_11505 [Bacteroidota bacterium]
MRKGLLLLLFGLLILRAWGQEKGDSLDVNELGIDGFVHASTQGGTFGFGLKYAFVRNKDFAFGPSLRYHRSWSNYAGVRTSFNIYGGGFFAHYRFRNLLFAGGEFEVLKSPLNFTISNSITNWVPTFFVGGGFSRLFEPTRIRLNAGMFYDLVNSPNSPFRLNYVAKNSNGMLLPFIYRIGVFIKLD